MEVLDDLVEGHGLEAAETDEGVDLFEEVVFVVVGLDIGGFRGVWV